jgi:hypothetical protein
MKGERKRSANKYAPGRIETVSANAPYAALQISADSVADGWWMMHSRNWQHAKPVEIISS